MKRIKRWLELLYERKISQDFDRIVILLGDEGMGKSTLSNETAALYKEVKGDGQAWRYAQEDPEPVLDTIAWNLSDFKEAMSSSPIESVIQVPDAARVLHKKKAMRSEQIELETDLLDVRMKGYLILLGYQDWDDIATPLQKRRAKNVLRITKRGTVRGYNRDSMDYRIEHGKWPSADLSDTFPSLEGTFLWDRFHEEDLRRKEERIKPDEEEEEEGAVDLKALAEQIKSDEEKLRLVVSYDDYHDRAYFDPDLIQVEHGLSTGDARTVKKLLSRDGDVDPAAVLSLSEAP